MKVTSLMTPKILRLVGISFLSVFLLQCTKGKEEHVNFVVNPNEPQVITADSQDGSGNPVIAPWYLIRSMTIENGSPSDLTLVAISFEMTGTDENGSPVTQLSNMSASEFNVNIVQGRATCKHEFQLFETIPAGSSMPLTVIDLNPEGSLPETDSESAVICQPVRINVGMYITGPKGTPRYNWSVKMKPLGWFEVSETEQERFEKTITFRTR